MKNLHFPSSVFPFRFQRETGGKCAKTRIFFAILVVVLFILCSLPGCRSTALQHAPYHTFEKSTQVGKAQNPLHARGDLDPFQVWETVVDVIRLYFDRIENEYPCQRSGDIITEGLLYTVPQTGATYLEPWRRDSANLNERQYATVQSVRRTAKVRVRYTDGNYIIHVRVDRELEDMAQPSYAVLPSATFRLDTQVPDTDDPVGVQEYHEGWIPQGRDYALEQAILDQLQLRLDATTRQSNS